MKLKYFLIFIFTLCIGALSHAQSKIDDDREELVVQISEFNKHSSSLNDTVTNCLSVKYDAKMNVVSITGRVKIAPDPFFEKFGEVYKAYYRKTQVVNIINNIANKEAKIWQILNKVKPNFLFIYYGKASTSFDINFNEFEYAKERIENGYKYLESYNDFLIEAYYCCLEKEELISLLWEQLIQPMANKTPYSSTEHIVFSRINMTSDNVVEYDYIQDDINGSEEELLNERMILFFELQSWKRGLLKAFAYNDIKIRYKFINKSNKEVFSDVTFSGNQLLEIYDSIN